MKKKRVWLDYLLILIGNFFVAGGVSFFVLPNDILTGGVAGIAVAIKPLINLDPVYVINGLTILLFIVGAIFLGREFAIKSIVSTIFYPLTITILSYVVTLFPENSFLMNELLASLYAGVFMGVGLGLVFVVGASTGGVDIIALMLSKYLHLKSGVAMMLVDGSIVILGILTYGIVDALVGIISVYVMGQVIDKMAMLHTEDAKKLLIISDKWDEIRQYLIQEIDRGVTVLDGHGGYSQEKKNVLMCIISKKQYTAIESKIMTIDPVAFLVVSDVNQVQGEGFTFLQENRLERENIR